MIVQIFFGNRTHTTELYYLQLRTDTGSNYEVFVGTMSVITGQWGAVFFVFVVRVGLSSGEVRLKWASFTKIRRTEKYAVRFCSG
jgi:hypothetical protein